MLVAAAVLVTLLVLMAQAVQVVVVLVNIPQEAQPLEVPILGVAVVAAVKD
jgi:hypothetical protein